jgi:rhodanese-related sulfurtransferase
VWENQAMPIAPPAAKHHHPAFVALVEDARRRSKHIELDAYRELAARGEPHVLIDVREDHEWNDGRASGAIHLSKGIIERDIEEKVPDKNATLVLYCGGGYRSVLAAEALQRMGYTNALSLEGGWRAWLGAGLPIES